MATETTMKSFGERLTHAIKLAKSSQSAVAKFVGVKPQSIQYLCSQKSTKSGYTTLIAQFLQVNPAWLSTGNGDVFGDNLLCLNFSSEIYSFANQLKIMSDSGKLPPKKIALLSSLLSTWE